MNRIILDTDVFSILFKERSEAPKYLPHLTNAILCLSFVTVGELYFWQEKHGWGDKKRSKLEARLKKFVVLPSNEQVCSSYAVLRNRLESRGTPMHFADLWIAATAHAYGLTVVTHNRKHFEKVKEIQWISES
jgi:tRNA(fMet)-specific endonuclease VapC